MVLLLVASQARGADLLVGPAQPYPTIGEAFAVALTGDRVLVDPGTYAEPLLDLDAARSLELAASGGPGTVLLLGTGDSVFEVRDGAQLTVTDLEVDGEGARRLAVVRTAATLALIGCDIHDTNSGNPSRAGGAVIATDATLAITGSTFSSSATRRRGGFLSVSRTVAVITTSSFTGGHADRDGGAIFADGGSTLVIDASTFDGNTADVDGAALKVDASSLSVSSSTFTANEATGAGAVQCQAATACDVSDSVFDGNEGGDGAAALAVLDTATATLLRTTVCRSSGRAAVVFDGTAGTVTNSVLLSNDTDEAAIRVEDDASATIVNNTFAGNLSNGVGTAVRVQGTATISNNLVAWSDGPVSAMSAAPVATATGGYQAYWQNAAADTDVPLPGDLVGIDPLVVQPPAESCDALALIPPATSPLVDGGDPAILDADGSPSDIGAWGGQAAPELVDLDGDGWYEGTDCDETNAAVHPGQPEVSCNGFDDDCDLATLDDGDVDADGVTICEGDCDDADPSRSTVGPRYTDGDGDGYGVGDVFDACGEPPATAAVDGDCDDAEPLAYPGAEDVPYDGIDQNCDGADLDDLDQDGALGADDCDDLDPARSPETDEIPEDGVDQDCTGHDATATLNGGAGARCGCATGSGGVGPLALLVTLFARRRRR